MKTNPFFALYGDIGFKIDIIKKKKSVFLTNNFTLILGRCVIIYMHSLDNSKSGALSLLALRKPKYLTKETNFKPHTAQKQKLALL